MGQQLAGLSKMICLSGCNKTWLEYKEPLRGAVLMDFSASLEMTNVRSK